MATCTTARNGWASPNDSSSVLYRDYPSVDACIADANRAGYGHVQRCACTAYAPEPVSIEPIITTSIPTLDDKTPISPKVIIIGIILLLLLLRR